LAALLASLPGLTVLSLLAGLIALLIPLATLLLTALLAVLLHIVCHLVVLRFTDTYPCPDLLNHLLRLSCCLDGTGLGVDGAKAP